MDHFTILFDLLLRQWYAAFDKTMRRNRHDVCRTIGKPDTRACKRNLHHVFRKIAGGVQHVLVSSGDAATRSVVISAEMRGDTPSFGSGKQKRQVDLSLMIDNRLRRFDHHLKLQATRGQICLLLESI